MVAESISVTVAYALAERQWLLPLRLPAGATVGDAIAQCGIAEQLPEVVGIGEDRVGVFGRPCALATPLRDGDRVELYRPLECDPKEVRRRRAGAEAETRRPQSVRGIRPP
jgi:uncharacterized protein